MQGPRRPERPSDRSGRPNDRDRRQGSGRQGNRDRRSESRDRRSRSRNRDERPENVHEQIDEIQTAAQPEPQPTPEDLNSCLLFKNDEEIKGYLKKYSKDMIYGWQPNYLFPDHEKENEMTLICEPCGSIIKGENEVVNHMIDNHKCPLTHQVDILKYGGFKNYRNYVTEIINSPHPNDPNWDDLDQYL